MWTGAIKVKITCVFCFKHADSVSDEAICEACLKKIVNARKQFAMKDAYIKHPCTIFIDIDGTIFEETGKGATYQLTEPAVLLPGVKDCFNKWSSLGYKIILVTARKESAREVTERCLRNAGLFWDNLLMGLSSGQRILINDFKPYSDLPTAVAINLERNQGVEAGRLTDAILEQSFLTQVFK
jgi:hypothetical protein